MDCSEKSFVGTKVREFHLLSTVNVEAHPPCAKSSLIVNQTAGVVPSFASRFRTAVRHKPNRLLVCRFTFLSHPSMGFYMASAILDTGPRTRLASEILSSFLTAGNIRHVTGIIAFLISYPSISPRFATRKSAML